MFTGLIEQSGEILRIERRGPDAALVVRAAFDDLSPGESVAVDGVCLTVGQVLGQGFAAVASAETLARTTLGRAAPGRSVHLERALAVGGRMGGHIVTGHVDAVARVLDQRPAGRALEVTYELPRSLAALVAEKGSIAVDGVSLTVNAVTAGAFRVMLVPFTREKTHLDRGRPGDEVNLEADVLARYVARALGWAGESQSDAGAIGGGLSLELLAKQGFMR
jgi:riboflavin synthase